jgi:site-specific DNA-methyltransferase (adenine-specific)
LADGWLLRNKVVWAKTNPMPSSVKDRLTLTWEVVYLFVRSPSYYFDLDAIREPHTSSGRPRSVTPAKGSDIGAGPLAASRGGLARAKAQGRPGHPLGKNPGDVWRLSTRGFRGSHFAVFPPELVRRPILSTCPPLVCSDCGLPAPPGNLRSGASGPRCPSPVAAQPGIVLDPFFGTGTVGLVARQLGRDYLGIELNPAYAELANQRLGRWSGKGAPSRGAT